MNIYNDFHFIFHKNLNPHEYFIEVESKVYYFSNKFKGSFFYFYHEHDFFYNHFYKLGDIDLCSED